MRLPLLLAALACAATPAAQAAQPIMIAAQPVTVAAQTVVVELFTSQGCSSCPPADALLGELSRTRADVLPLAFHVTYWDSLGWRDPFALPAATARQRGYVQALGLASPYTPQVVVNGHIDAVGSDRAAVLDAIRQAAAERPAATLSVTRDGGTVRVEGTGGAGTLWLVGYDPQHRTAVGRGENGGRTLLESNIVRSVQDLGPWPGGALRVQRPAPEGERLAVLVQAADGRIVGAAREAPATPPNPG